MSASVPLLLLLLAACGSDSSGKLVYPRQTMAIVARVDLDHDGVVSKKEYTELAFPDEPMDPWDADHDDALEPAEIENAFLKADPTRLQLEGRRAVYEKYGYPFGEPTMPAVQRPSGPNGGAPDDPNQKPRNRNRNGP